jgi:hypothetical protein
MQIPCKAQLLTTVEMIHCRIETRNIFRRGENIFVQWDGGDRVETGAGSTVQVPESERSVPTKAPGFLVNNGTGQMRK